MTKYAHWPDATLMIDGSYSQCNNCGRDCNPHAKRHIKNLGWHKPTRQLPGCGIQWTHVASTLSGPDSEAAVREMRPDLEFIDWPEVVA